MTSRRHWTERIGSKREVKRRRAARKPCCELCERSLPGRHGRRDFRPTREQAALRFEETAG